MTDTHCDDQEEVLDDLSTIDPLASLEKTQMNLGKCKNDYFNAKSEGINYFNEAFWSQYDSAGYSVHYGRNYNGELSSLDFVRRNRVAGLTQEMDANTKYAHKYLFGVFKIVVNSDFSRDIVALFITRGQEVLGSVFGEQNAFFDWTKLNTDDQSTKDIVSSAFSTVVGEVFDGNKVEHHVVFV